MAEEAIAADPGAFIAAALRKKFSSVTRSSAGGDSPSSGKENDMNSSWDSSPERQSPAFQPKVNLVFLMIKIVSESECIAHFRLLTSQRSSTGVIHGIV